MKYITKDLTLEGEPLEIAMMLSYLHKNTINISSGVTLTGKDIADAFENHFDKDSLADYYRSIGVLDHKDTHGQVAIDPNGTVNIFTSDNKEIYFDDEEWMLTDGNYRYLDTKKDMSNVDWTETHMWIKDL
jgi:hypothetical protein